jgi:predicted DNA binding CopG/RHH family protein
MKKHKVLPKFKTAAEEQAFWQKHDSTEYVDWSNAKKVNFSRLKPSTRTISLRLPETLLFDIKRLANKFDIPYQSFMKMLLAEKVQEASGHK